MGWLNGSHFSICNFFSQALICRSMTLVRRKRPIWGKFAAGFLHPVPVFFIVAALSALVYNLSDLFRLLGAPSVLSYGRTSFILNALLPAGTGLIAAIGVHFGLADVRRRTTENVHEDASKQVLSGEEKSRTVARNLPMAVVTLGPDGTVTFLNPAASELFDIHSREDYHRIQEFIDAAGLRRGLEEIFGGNRITRETTVTTGQSPGEERAWRITGVPVTRREEVTDALLLLEDRTQYRLLEDELLRSEDRYRNIFNYAPCGIFVTDSQGRYLDANPAALRMLGYTLEELGTLNTRELSADSDRRLRRLREAPGWVEEETKYLRKDGKVVEAQLLASSFQTGNETYFIGITRDLTARRELERNLKAAEAGLKTVLSLESRPLILFDAQDRVANVNAAAARLLDCPPDRLLGVPLADLIQEDLPPVQDATSAAPSACVLHVPEGPSMRLSVLRLTLGGPRYTGSLLLLSPGPIPVRSSRS